MQLSTLEDDLKHIPTEPGVYRMRDAEGQVLYVGKASNLKKRVTSYFRQYHQGAKTSALVSQIASIDVSVTRSETEALLLESNLIKSLRPKYNVLMRDDKSYPYLHVSLAHPFPGMNMVRLKDRPQTAHYLGPYPGVVALKETLNVIQKIFNIRHCRDSEFSARSRPCLQYQLHRCSAPCVGFISAEDYQQAVRDALNFLQGKSQAILEAFEARMALAVEQLAFEEAAVLRDQIKHLRLIQEQQAIHRAEGDADVIVLQVVPGFACVQWVSIREGQILDSQGYFPKVPKEDAGIDVLWQQVFEAFITHYYRDHGARIPALIITDHELDDRRVIEQLLSDWRGRACRVVTRPRGAHAKWLDFALNNLQRVQEERHASAALMRQRYEALQQWLHFDSPIVRMVCFDISHTQGQDTVASCVVFDEKGPCKRAYRYFNIEGITPGDDYAAMEQAVSRYVKRLKQEDWPTLIIIDGGKGQVVFAQRVLTTLNMASIKLLGIAKGPERKAGLERLVFANAEHEISLPPDSLALHLLQHIRDEAHRFAITRHRKKRHKTGLSSSMTSIPGVGAKRRHALLQRFGGLREVAKASIEEMTKIPGISLALAEKIYEHFHGV